MLCVVDSEQAESAGHLVSPGGPDEVVLTVRQSSFVRVLTAVAAVLSLAYGVVELLRGLFPWPFVVAALWVGVLVLSRAIRSWKVRDKGCGCAAGG